MEAVALQNDTERKRVGLPCSRAATRARCCWDEGWPVILYDYSRTVRFPEHAPAATTTSSSLITATRFPHSSGLLSRLDRDRPTRIGRGRILH